MDGPGGTAMDDMLVLEIDDLEVDVLTGIYSEETHLPQPLRISIRVLLKHAAHYDPDAPLGMSKNYMDLKHAATTALTHGQHFTLIEAVADHINRHGLPAGHQGVACERESREAGAFRAAREDRDHAGALAEIVFSGSSPLVSWERGCGVEPLSKLR